MSVTTTATIASFGGKLLKLSHAATTTKCEMKFNLYLPPQAQTQKVPVLIYLSGLTCTAENCSEKGFFQHGASKKGIAVLYPDTSPRRSTYALLLHILGHQFHGFHPVYRLDY
jgi:S-formylglutathione hydrolase